MIIPEKLKKGDEVRVIAPSRSLSVFALEQRKIAIDRFESLGLTVSFGAHTEETDEFVSSSIKSRLLDLHSAFSDRNVKAVFTVIGGFNCNQLLQFIDYKLIKKNPKIFCGYSDITALNNSIYAKTGLMTYSGVNFAEFGMKKGFEYTFEHFKKCFFSSEPFKIIASKEWSDDEWYKNQDDRKVIANKGHCPITEGEAEGKIIGGNLCTLNLLQGTKFMPSLKNSILFIEDDYESKPHTFDRDLQSLIHLPDFKLVKGLVIGRFQKDSEMDIKKLKTIINTKKELASIPVVADVDFGHTNPKIVFPIGGTAKISVKKNKTELEILTH